MRVERFGKVSASWDFNSRIPNLSYQKKRSGFNEVFCLYYLNLSSSSFLPLFLFFLRIYRFVPSPPEFLHPFPGTGHRFSQLLREMNVFKKGRSQRRKSYRTSNPCSPSCTSRSSCSTLTTCAAGGPFPRSLISFRIKSSSP